MPKTTGTVHPSYNRLKRTARRKMDISTNLGIVMLLVGSVVRTVNS